MTPAPRHHLPLLQHDFHAASHLLMMVAELMHEANDELIAPAIAARQAVVTKKADTASGGDFVLSIDINCEAFLSQRLRAFIPGSYAVGEESFDESDAHQMDRLSAGTSWVIDPLDGTNSVKRVVTGEEQGAPSYGTLIALLHEGLPEAAWVLTSGPTGIDVACGMRGHGAHFYDRETGALSRIGLSARTGNDLLTIPQTYPAPFNGLIAAQAAGGVFQLYADPPKSAAHHTMLMLQGAVSATAFRQYRLWDHLPGQLLVEEAGGCARLFNGESAKLAHHRRDGMLFAQSPGHWQKMRYALLGDADYTHTERPADTAAIARPSLA